MSVYWSLAQSRFTLPPSIPVEHLLYSAELYQKARRSSQNTEHWSKLYILNIYNISSDKATIWIVSLGTIDQYLKNKTGKILFKLL